MSNNTINSIQRAISILNLYRSGEHYLGIAEISRRMDLPKASVYRIVNTLAEQGWLVQDKKSGQYRLGWGVLVIARLVSEQYEIHDIILQAMTRLKDVTGETVILTVYEKGQGICIEKVESDRGIKLTSHPGQLIPLHAGASGKILLAFASQQDIDKVLSGNLERFTDNTPQDPDALRFELRTILQKGYAVSYGESDDGAFAVGVPILDEKSNFRYGLSVAGPIERMEKIDLDTLLAQMRETVRRISEAIKLFG